MLDRFFSLRIALFSGIGYCSAIAGPLWIDGKLISHVRYGARHYPHGWVWWLFTPLAVVLPYFGLRYCTSQASLYLAAAAPLLLMTATASISFPPERPHLGLVSIAVGFLIVTIAAVGSKLAGNDVAYLVDTTLARDLRLERLKANIAFWQMIAVYASAGYLAFFVAWLYATWFITERMVTAPEDRFVLGQSEVAIGILVTICVIFGPLFEAFANTFRAIRAVTDIK